LNRLHIIPQRVLRERPFRRAAWQAVLRLARELRAEQYQVALDLQGLLKSAIWGVLGGIPLGRTACAN
jgi:heptosyltransferase-1